MAKKTITHITDDLDGESEAETVKFGLWGATYEIDLSKENQKKLESALEPYLEVAVKAGTAPSRRTPGPRVTSPASPSYDAKSVRIWAAENGITVPPRGRIPGTVIEQYQAAGH